MDAQNKSTPCPGLARLPGLPLHAYKERPHEGSVFKTNRISVGEARPNTLLYPRVALGSRSRNSGSTASQSTSRPVVRLWEYPLEK
jgi:hypothetical protein